MNLVALCAPQVREVASFMYIFHHSVRHNNMRMRNQMQGPQGELDTQKVEPDTLIM